MKAGLQKGKNYFKLIKPSYSKVVLVSNVKTYKSFTIDKVNFNFFFVNQQKFNLTMKTKFFFLIPFTFAFALLFTSCQKDNELTEEDIVESIEAALKTNGSDEMSLISTPYKSAACGYTNDTTVMRSATGTGFAWSRTANWTWVVNCDVNNAYNNVVFTEGGNSTYYGPRVDWTATHTGSFTVTNLLVSEPNYIVNGSMTRNATGAVTTRRRSENYSSTIVHSWANVNVDKTSRSIVSGSGAVNYSGTMAGNTVTRTGSLVYNGNGTATLTMDNGNVFTIQTR